MKRTLSKIGKLSCIFMLIFALATTAFAAPVNDADTADEDQTEVIDIIDGRDEVTTTDESDESTNEDKVNDIMSKYKRNGLIILVVGVALLVLVTLLKNGTIKQGKTLDFFNKGKKKKK